MTGLERIRRRVPLVFVLLVVIVLLMVGFACACFSDRPLAAEGTLGAGVSTPALIEMWAMMVVVLIAAPAALSRQINATGRASPAVVQCFLR